MTPLSIPSGPSQNEMKTVAARPARRGAERLSQWRNVLFSSFAAAWMAFAPSALHAADLIRPGEVWNDHRGQHIQAHGGGVIKDGDTWFWFGEDRAKENDPEKRFVACYSSKDLVHWTFRNKVLQLSNPENFVGSAWVVERPKVFHNRETGKYVMYFHLDGALTPEQKGYAAARVGIAVSDKIDGDYKYVRSFRPLGLESRDIGQFIDDDGSAYLIFESRPSKGFFIGKLSRDFMDVEKQVAFIPESLEGGCIVHLNGLYYVIGSHLTSWAPNPNVYATASRLEGPWTGFKNIAPPEKNTYGSQSTMLLKVTGTKGSTVIFMADIWKPGAQWDSRYLWMPLKIGAGELSLPEPAPWSIDVATGESKISGK
jgi:hypothetical protein